MPQDALVITDLYSDFHEWEPDDVRLMQGAWDVPHSRCLFDITTKEGFNAYQAARTEGRPTSETIHEKVGLIRHNGHLMLLEERWWPRSLGPKPENSEYLTAVHFRGN